MLRNLFSAGVILFLSLTICLAGPVLGQEPGVVTRRLVTTVALSDSHAWVPLMVMVGAPQVEAEEQCRVSLEFQRLVGGVWRVMLDAKSDSDATRSLDALPLDVQFAFRPNCITPVFVRRPEVIGVAGQWRVRANSDAVVVTDGIVQSNARGCSAWSEFAILPHKGNEALVERCFALTQSGRRGGWDLLCDLLVDDPTTVATGSGFRAASAHFGAGESTSFEDLVALGNLSPAFLNWIALRQCLVSLAAAESVGGEQRIVYAHAARAKLEQLPAGYLPAAMVTFVGARLEAVDPRMDATALTKLREEVREAALPLPCDEIVRSGLLRLGLGK